MPQCISQNINLKLSIDKTLRNLSEIAGPMRQMDMQQRRGSVAPRCGTEGPGTCAGGRRGPGGGDLGREWHRGTVQEGLRGSESEI